MSDEEIRIILTQILRSGGLDAVMLIAKKGPTAHATCISLNDPGEIAWLGFMREAIKTSQNVWNDEIARQINDIAERN